MKDICIYKDHQQYICGLVRNRIYTGCIFKSLTNKVPFQTRFYGDKIAGVNEYRLMKSFSIRYNDEIHLYMDNISNKNEEGLKVTLRITRPSSGTLSRRLV